MPITTTPPTRPVDVPATRLEKVAQTRERLLDAAEALFTERGFLDVSVEEIAARAGYTRGAVYGNFDGREGLFLGVAERRGQVAYPARRPDEPDQWARELLDLVVRHVRLLRGLTRAHVEFTVVAYGRPDLQQRLASLDSTSHAAFESYAADVIAVAAGVPPARARRRATALRAMVNGLLLESVADPGFDVARHVSEGVAALLTSA